MSLLGGGGGASKARVTMSFYMTFFYFDGVPKICSVDFFKSRESTPTPPPQPSPTPGLKSTRLFNPTKVDHRGAIINLKREKGTWT